MSHTSVSFIIPYYKVSFPLLQRCINSVRALGNRIDWEIRLIDDGTPGHEAEDYINTLEDGHIHYHKQENQGLSMARNNGWNFCKKEYIHFLDADDYLFLTPTLLALDILDKEHPDLLAFNFRKVYDENMSDQTVGRPKIKFRGSGTSYMLRHNLHGAAWGYFFRKQAAGNVRFTPGIYHEDEEFTPLLWLRMQDVIVTNLPVYAYQQRDGSILHDTDMRKIRKRYDDMLNILIRLRNESHQLPAESSRALFRRTYMVALAMIYTLMHETPDEIFLRDTLERMRRNGFYPLPPTHRSFLYVTFRLCTFHPFLVCMLSRLIFRK